MASEQSAASPRVAGVLILGSAACLWRDLEKAGGLGLADWQILAVNHAGVVYEGRMDHWVSLHPDRFAGWRAQRGGTARAITYGPWMPDDEAIGLCQAERWSGGSGLYGVQIALDVLGAARVLLAGIPLDAGPYVFDTVHRFGPADALGRYRAAWRAASYFFEGRVRSMSGWSRDLLGAPEADWLEENSANRLKKQKVSSASRSINGSRARSLRRGLTPLRR